MTLEEIVDRLSQRKLKIVAEKTGLSYMTIYKIATGENTNPTLGTLKLLEIYFKENPWW